MHAHMGRSEDNLKGTDSFQPSDMQDLYTNMSPTKLSLWPNSFILKEC